MYADTLFILSISIFTAFLGEGLTWLLVYRTETYKKLKFEVEKQSKKLEKQKEVVGETSDRSSKKKIERQEERLKNNNRDLSLVKMKSMFAIGFCFTALLSMFNSIFDGRVVAKLPFIPFSLIQNLSQESSRRGLHRLFLHLPLHPLHHGHSPEHTEDARLRSLEISEQPGRSLHSPAAHQIEINLRLPVSY